MITIILLGTALVIYVVIVAMYWSQMKPSGNLRFGVSLPADAMDDERLDVLQTSYKKMYTKYGFITLLCLIPVPWLSTYTSLSLIYFFMWTAGTMLLLRIPFVKTYRVVTELKRENEWFVGEKRIVRMDTKLSLLKKEMTLSPYWFIVPALIASLNFMFSVPDDAVVILRAASGIALGVTVLLLIINLSFNKMKPKVYTYNSEMNILLNRANRRYWSLLWFGIAMFNSCTALITVYALTLNREVAIAIWSVGTFIFSIVPVLSILYIHNKLHRLEVDILKGEQEIIFTDDDEYWINGTTYNNPNNHSIMVPKRIGIGSTINIGTKAGKSIYYGLFVLVAFALIGIGWLAVQTDFSTPTLSTDADGTVSIKFPMYNYSFAMKDVQELTLVDHLPSGGRRTNGVATDAVAIGNFKFDEFGKSKLYLVKNSPPYIVIKLPDVYVLYNNKDANETLRIYAVLKGR